jgi:predicted ATPase
VAEQGIRTPDQRLRVFVSSTLGELADERLAARTAIEQLRLTPVMFELGARPHPPRALYRSYLAQSDVFVGIYWQRYGWVAPDMDISGLEDELVLSGDLPRLMYVKRPAPELEPRLGQMLERMQDEDTVSYKPFRDADELQRLLADDLALLLTEHFDAVREASTEEARPRHNLPAQTSTFLGREAELRDVRKAIAADDVRLVTLTGPGGTGKTRLAIQAAREEVERFADGVLFVDLSAERDPEGAYAAIARTVGVTVAGETRTLDALAAELGDRHTLLVLDNVEQVTSAAVGIVELLERCPDVKVLATSREALRVRAEHTFTVPPLSLPSSDDPAVAAGSEAVRLFTERAEAVQPGFRFSEENAAAIAAICRLLDGLPLAIELAAARVQLFDVHDLQARLEDRLDVLRGGARDLPKRQQALRDAIAWSYDLLDSHERDGLRVFSVFGDALLPDVEAVTRGVPALSDVDVVEVLGSLVDKSLVRSTQGSAGRPRFSMLRTIRAFATEQLADSPELASAARQAHAEHYTEVACRLHQQLTLASRDEVLSALSDELANLRGAWGEWVARADVPKLNDLLPSLWGYYEARGDYRSMLELGNDLLACLAATPDSPDRRRDEFVVRMNLVRSELAVRGFTAESEQMIRDALEGAAPAGDVRQRFPGLRSLCYLHLMRSEIEEMDVVAEEMMAIAEQEGDPLLLSEAHLLLGLSRAWLEGYPTAIAHYEDAVENFAATSSGHVDFRVGPNPGVTANVVAGLSQWMVGCAETASASMQQALDLAASLDHPYSMAYALHHAALLDLWRLDLDAVARRARELLEIVEVHDYPAWRALAFVWEGMALVAHGDGGPGMARIDEGFELYQGISVPPIFWPGLLLLRASALGMAGRRDEGLREIREAAGLLLEGDPLGPDVGIVEGDLLLLPPEPDPEAAAAAFERAASHASARGARMPELQARTRLAELRRGTSGAPAATEELRRVYETFEEGLDTPQVQAARAVLDAST